MLTTPAGVTTRMALLPVSSTYSSPCGPTATDNGAEKRAALPLPLANPAGSAGLPARVVVTPWALMRRMALLLRLATYSVPLRS